MPGKPTRLQPAYVLHQRAYRDSSAIVELFTPEQGRVGVVARGIKRPRSPWRGLLQPFQPLLVAWQGGGELKTLTGAEPQGMALGLPPSALASGFYLNELLMRLLARHDAQLTLFGCYDAGLRALASAHDDASLERVLRHFECDLLEALGYGLSLTRDTRGLPVAAGQRYDYLHERGPRPLDDAAEVEGIALHGATLLAIHERQVSGERTRREAKRLMRATLAHYLGPRPLVSRQLLMPRPASATNSTHTKNERTPHE